MKIACERCEKIITTEDKAFHSWRVVKVFDPFRPEEMLGSEILLCDYCYDKFLDCVQMVNPHDE